MPTLCLHCALKALTEQREAEIFDEDPDVHQQRVHPDLEATMRERRELEEKATAMLPLLMARTKGVQ
jgi:hypothetical protein